MTTDNYTRLAKVRKVIDGDTIEVLVDCGYRRFSIERVRLNRINCPEIRGEEREKGLISKAYVESVLKEGDNIVITSFKGDAFGRWLAELYYGEDQKNLSDVLLELGLAVPFKD